MLAGLTANFQVNLYYLKGKGKLSRVY